MVYLTHMAAGWQGFLRFGERVLEPRGKCAITVQCRHPHSKPCTVADPVVVCTACCSLQAWVCCC